MPLLRCLRASFLFLVCSLAFATITAHACPATTQDVLFVGNTASASACNYNTIQAAINAATCPTATKIYDIASSATAPNPWAFPTKILRAPNAHCGALSVVCGMIFPCSTYPLETISGCAGSGGGIDYDGTGTLTIDTSSIADHPADYGGGINFKGSNGYAELHSERNSVILLNTANVSRQRRCVPVRRTRKQQRRHRRHGDLPARRRHLHQSLSRSPGADCGPEPVTDLGSVRDWL